MTPLSRTATTLTASVLLALSLTACGGGDGGGSDSAEPADAPSSASVDEFCGVIEDLQKKAGDIDEDDTEGQAEALKDLGQQWSEVGTPEDMPEDARQGFEVIAKTLTDIDPSKIKTEDDIFNFTGEDKTTTEAFQKYVVSNCDVGQN